MQNGVNIHASSRLKEISAIEGVPCSFHRKYDLDKLYKITHEMNLEIITKNVNLN